MITAPGVSHFGCTSYAVFVGSKAVAFPGKSFLVPAEYYYHGLESCCASQLSCCGARLKVVMSAVSGTTELLQALKSGHLPRSCLLSKPQKSR